MASLFTSGGIRILPSPTSQYVARVVCFAESRLNENLLKERDRLIGRIKPCADVSGKRRIVKPKKLTDDVNEIPVSSGLPAKVRKTESKPGQHLMEQLIKQRSEKTQAPVNESINDMQRRMKELQDENKQLKEELENCRRQMNAHRSFESLLAEIPGLLNDIKNLRESQPQTEPELSCKVFQSWAKTPQRMLQDFMSQSFTREEMAAHSLTGKKSNANGSLPSRPQLDPEKMEQLFRKVRCSFPDVDTRSLKEAACNKLSNERKLSSRGMY